MFQKWRGPRLTPSDLKRFGRRFVSDLESLMPGRRCRVIIAGSAEDDEIPGALSLPLEYQGRELGRLVVTSDQGRPASAELIMMLGEMARQGLSAMRLRKALMTDRETGLFSRDHLSGGLIRAIRKRGHQAAAKSLSMDGEAAPELLLISVELRGETMVGQSLADLAARLTGRLPARCTSRVGEREVAFLAEGRPEDLRAALETALEDQLAAEPDSRPAAAWARYPHDVGETGPGPDDDIHSWARREAQGLFDRVETALFYARQSRNPAALVAFGDLVREHGQVVQVLPLDRVVINLGRVTGAASGQVFLVSAPRDKAGDEPRYKGEVTIFETAESYSIGHITSQSPAPRIVAGDRLSFSRDSAEDVRHLDQARPAPAGFMAGLPSWDDFLADLDRVPRDKPVALALVRLDGYEKTLSVIGREEGDRLLNFLFERVSATFPETALKGLRNCYLALAWPEVDQVEIKPAAHRLVTELREAGPISIGLAFSPAGWDSSRRLADDGQKALTEATFSGQGQVAVFGPLSLNISGDRLFEGGDLSGALKEYERGLALAPGHLNLLNSLGVCHGRLGNAAEALATFERIAGLDPDNMMAHYNVGYTHLLAGRLDEAEKALEKAAELAPDNFEALFLLGKISLEAGHLDKALPALKRAGDLEGSRPIVHRLLGEALMLARDNQGALAAFKKAVKYAPNDAYALSSLGALFVDLANDLEVARSLFQKSVEIDPTNSLYRQRLGRLLFSLGDFGGAEHHLKMAMEYGSRAPEVHFQLGCVAEETGRADEALAHFQAALEQDPAFKPALDKLAGD